MVALLDQPRVKAETVRTLLAHAFASDVDYVVPSHGERCGHPFLLRTQRYNVDRLSPTATVRDSLLRLSRAVVPVDDIAILDDLDTPADAVRLGVTTVQAQPVDGS
jgi:CTP:molybdopterin cytidylyltransferase MocA